MDFSKLKEIAKRLGGILVMNGNEPEFVIMAYEKYMQEGEKNEPSYARASESEDPMLDALNKEILALKEEIRQKELSEAQMI